MITRSSRIFVAGHHGLVGSAILRLLNYKGYKNIFVADRKEVNLINQEQVFKYITKIKPEFIFIAAAKVGGIMANHKFKAEFIYNNLSIQNNIIHGAYCNGVKNLIFLGSSCIYPKDVTTPIKEKYLLTGKLERTNESYSIAKIAGIKMCESYNFQYGTNYKCLMPSNIYGPNDNFSEISSHFYSALIRKLFDCINGKKKFIEVWGDGTVKRELIFVDDVAQACVHFMHTKTKESLINIGSGKEYSIRWYVNFLQKILKTNFKVKYNNSLPRGVDSKILDSSVANKYGWKSSTSLTTGTLETIDFYKKNILNLNEYYNLKV